MAVKYLKSMIKRVLSEGTSQRAGGGGMSAWRAVRNGFVRCKANDSSGCRFPTLQGRGYRRRLLYPRGYV